jgi:hypothetical protein
MFERTKAIREPSRTAFGMNCRVSRFHSSCEQRSNPHSLRLGFESPNERCEGRRDGTRHSVVLVPQGFPNCQHPNASTATRKPLRRLGSVTVLNYMPGDPLMDRVSGGERGHSRFPRLRLLIRADRRTRKAYVRFRTKAQSCHVSRA